MTSKSAFSRGKAATRWLSRATTLTVFASLIGYQLGNIQDTAIKRQVELEDLQINLSASQAERELKQALTTTREEVSEDTNDGSTALRQLARSFATTFARTWRTAEAHNATEARAERARQIVELRNDIHAEREAGSTKFWSADEVASAWPGEIRAAVSDFAKDTLGQEFSTPLQERFIRDAAKENLHRDSRVKGFWARMAKEGPGREPIPIRDLIDYQIEETVGALVDGILGETISCEMCKSALKSLSTYAKERIKRTYRIAWAKYVASFLRTGDLGVAEAAVRTSCSDLPMDELRATISSITRSPTKTIASIRAAKAKARARGAETQRAFDVLRNLPSAAYEGQELGFANVLSNYYDAEFPNSTDVETARDRILATWNVHDENPVIERARRATSFESLRSYSRVGGILLGRAPSDSADADLTGFEWLLDVNGLTIILRSSAKDWATLGPFPPYLIHQAIRYASDGRGTVVTLMNADKIERKQAIIHPAFEDSPLGLRLIAADEWIFEYTERNRITPPGAQPIPLSDTIRQLRAGLDVYKDAIRFLNKSDKGREPTHLDEGRRSDVQHGISMLTSAGLGLDESLLGAISDCTKPGPASWTDCVAKQAVNSGCALRSKRLPSKGPNTAIVSQVLEGEYSLGAGLSGILKAPSPESSNMWPLDLTVQLVVDDKALWELPGFRQYGPREVLSGLTKDAKLAQWNELRALCVLQRVFRLAFAGRMGPNFPVEQLVRLADEVRNADAPKCATPRWLAYTVSEAVEADAMFEKELKQYQSDSNALRQDADSNIATERVTKCVDARVRFGGDSDKSSNCPWESIRRDMLRDCQRMHASSHVEHDKIASCRLFWLAHLGLLTDQMRQLRGALPGSEAAPRSVCELECAKQLPSVTAAPLETFVRHEKQR